MLLRAYSHSWFRLSASSSILLLITNHKMYLAFPFLSGLLGCCGCCGPVFRIYSTAIGYQGDIQYSMDLSERFGMLTKQSCMAGNGNVNRLITNVNQSVILWHFGLVFPTTATSNDSQNYVACTVRYDCAVFLNSPHQPKLVPPCSRSYRHCRQMQFAM